jgi:hypothetical protein
LAAKSLTEQLLALATETSGLPKLSGLPKGLGKLPTGELWLADEICFSVFAKGGRDGTGGVEPPTGELWLADEICFSVFGKGGGDGTGGGDCCAKRAERPAEGKPPPGELLLAAAANDLSL